MIAHRGAKAPKDWKKKFLKALSKCPVIDAACKSAGVSRTWAYLERKNSEKFKEAWDTAYEQAYSRLDKVHFDLAVNGQRRGVWRSLDGRPVRVETITEYTPQMMQWLLSKHYEKYKDTSRIEHSGPDNGPMQFQQLPPLVPKELEDGV